MFIVRVPDRRHKSSLFLYRKYFLPKLGIQFKIKIVIRNFNRGSSANDIFQVNDM